MTAARTLAALFPLSLACTSSQSTTDETASMKPAKTKASHTDSTPAMKPTTARASPTSEIALHKGQIFTVAVSRHREGAEGKMQQYFQAVGPIAKPFGFAKLGALKVVEADAGSFEPNNFVGFYGFPSQDDAMGFASDPRWPAIRDTRDEIWSELRISHYKVQTAKELSFDSSLVYEVRYEFVPTKDSPSLEMKGAKTILDLVEGSHEMTPSTLAAPIRIRVLEWASLEKAKAAPQPQANGRVDSLYTQFTPPS